MERDLRACSGRGNVVPRQDAATFRQSALGRVPSSFREALATLGRLIARREALFPGRRFEPGDDEFRAHEALYARARRVSNR